MAIRAKFKCDAIHQLHDAGKPVGTVAAEIVKLTPVYGKDGSENAQWSKWTPSGELTMQINNPGAFGAFKLGAEYFIDITPALPAE